MRTDGGSSVDRGSFHGNGNTKAESTCDNACVYTFFVCRIKMFAGANFCKSAFSCKNHKNLYLTKISHCMVFTANAVACNHKGVTALPYKAGFKRSLSGACLCYFDTPSVHGLLSILMRND